MTLPLLPEPPTRNDPANFSERADSFLSALPAWTEAANMLEQSLQASAYTGSSTTTLTIGIGSKTLATQSGKSWMPGAFVYIVSASNVNNLMCGQITAYNAGSGAMTVNVVSLKGSGVISSWAIGLAAPDSASLLLAGGAAGQMLLPGGVWGPFPFTTLAGYGITDGMRFFPAGAALPASNIGPIWHEGYGSVMTWQVFNNAGANYTGYASVNIGRIFYEPLATPRTGTVAVGSAALSKSSGMTVQLWNWALHNMVFTALGSWSQGRLVYADNGDGTFRTPDTRGYFQRTWNSGGGAVPTATIGEKQADEIKATSGSAQSIMTDLVGATSGGLSLSSAGLRFATPADGNGGQAFKALYLSFGSGPETRPHNTSFLGVIQL